MPSNQIIEQVKFTYSPLGKAFGKQTKKIEYQGEKQIKAIQEHGKQLVKSNTLIKKYELSKKTDLDNLIYIFKDKRIPKIDFGIFDNALDFLYKIKIGKITLQDT